MAQNDGGSKPEVKERMVAGKQTILEKVLDRHDTLVREVFHMENFTSMLAYNPEEAKQDNSTVFREYKSEKNYDLFEQASTSEAGPSRRTRRSQKQQSQLLRGTVSAPITNGKSKKKAVDTNAIWDILTQSKKGKAKASADMQSTVDTASSVDLGESISSAPSRRRSRIAALEPTESISAPPKRQASAADISISRKRHKPDTNRVDDPGGTNGISTRPRRILQRNATAPVPRPKSSVTVLSSPVKRIKLIVRRPPLLYSNPLQVPKPKKHNSSLTEFLGSYTTISDTDVTTEAIQEMVTQEANLRQRIADLQRQGRLVPKPDIDNLVEYYEVPNRPKTDDVWSHCVEAVIAYKRPKLTGKRIASEIASKIQSYWVDQAAKQDKLRQQEQKKLRILAKNTIKTVVAEWKKAVFHIREQERQKLESEERKRGERQLDAILDQSGQILETQHGDLARGTGDHSRSRSSSVSAHLAGWGSEEDEESGSDQDEEEEEEEEGAPEEDVEGDDADGQHTGEDFTPKDSQSQTPRSVSEELSMLQQSVEDDDLAEETSSAIAVDEMMTRPSTPSEPSRSPSTASAPGLTYYMLGSRSPSIGDDRNRPPRSPSPMDISEKQVASRSPSVPPIDYPSSPTVNGHVGEGEAETPGASDQALDEALDSLTNAEQTTKTPDQMEVEPEEEPPDTELKASGGDDPVVDKVPSEPETTPGDPKEDQTVEGEPLDEEASLGETDDTKKDDLDPTIDIKIPEYMKPFAVAPVAWDPTNKVLQPLLLRGNLRPYQQAGLEWLASLHRNNMNGILADEMGLGKTIQTISLLAHLACDRGIWGPHLIIVPTSVLLNWEMEFKKFLPGFKILSYHGTTKRRKELRQGWTDKYHFNVCVTSYTLASRDAHIFKRKAWYYMILDEAHMIKNFKSQRWNILLMFRSFRRLLLTGTPLQNNLTELWALLQFLMSGSNFANLKEFGDWFSNPLEKAIEMGNIQDEDTIQRVTKLHTVLRPYLLRRLKRDVEKELPSKFEHLVFCPLSKRQRFLYDEFMSRAQTKDALQSGVYQKIANILMQLRKVCNHPDLFEVRPIVTSFAMEKSAIADYEIKELLIRRQLLKDEEERVNLDLLGLDFVHHQNRSLVSVLEGKRLDASYKMPFVHEAPGLPPPKDTRTIEGFRAYAAWQSRAKQVAYWSHLAYVNRLRLNTVPIYSQELITLARRFSSPILPLSEIDLRTSYLDTVQRLHSAVKSYSTRAEGMAPFVDRFAFATPTVVALDMPHITFSGRESALRQLPLDFDAVLHRASVKLQIAFPDTSLLQYDCGKLQELTRLLREKKARGSRVLIFTQMTRILDVLEIYLNFHGYLYLRLDGATKIEDRQYITERFNADNRVFCFIASSRSGGVGINLTGADTVIFYDSDFNPQMDRQCEDRAHRIGQIRDVHIYRFVSQHTVEEALLRKANQKRSLDDLVIQKGEFDWRSLFNDENALTKALGEFEDREDAHAAEVAAREEVVMYGADEMDFGVDPEAEVQPANTIAPQMVEDDIAEMQNDGDPEEGGTIVDYMLSFVRYDYDFFREWRL